MESDTSKSAVKRGTVVDFPRALDRPLEKLFRENESRLLQFLRLRLNSEHDAKDAAQRAFLGLWGRRDELKNDNLVALLFVTARNIATDILRQRARLPLVEQPQDGVHIENVADPSADPHRILSARRDVSLIIKIVDELPPKCRTAFLGYKMELMSYADIAAQMGVTESMVRKYVIRAVVHCVKRFEELEGWE